MNQNYRIIPFIQKDHESPVVVLWREVFGYSASHNEPRLVIRKKMSQNDGLFFVAESSESDVLGTIMCGYDGHRGWIYSLAVSPVVQRTGLGKEMMKYAESVLKEKGCVKINLQVVKGNEKAVKFYEAIGYAAEERISMGKKISDNIQQNTSG